MSVPMVGIALEVGVCSGGNLLRAVVVLDSSWQPHGQEGSCPLTPGCCDRTRCGRRKHSDPDQSSAHKERLDLWKRD